MFISGVLGYLFVNVQPLRFLSPKDFHRVKLKPKKLSQDVEDLAAVPNDIREDRSSRTPDEIDAALCRSAERGHHRYVIKDWKIMKELNRVPTVPLSKVVESMQCSKKGAQFIVDELTGHFQKHHEVCNITIINDIIEAAGKRIDLQLIELIVQTLPLLGLTPDPRTSQILVAVRSATPSCTEGTKCMRQPADRTASRNPPVNAHGALLGHAERCESPMGVERCPW